MMSVVRLFPPSDSAVCQLGPKMRYSRQLTLEDTCEFGITIWHM
jgi:hypothetical protein